MKEIVSLPIIIIIIIIIIIDKYVRGVGGVRKNSDRSESHTLNS
jgi:hypothetical protein